MIRIGTIVWGLRDVEAAVAFWKAALDCERRADDSPGWVLLRPKRGTGVPLAL